MDRCSWFSRADWDIVGAPLSAYYRHCPLDVPAFHHLSGFLLWSELWWGVIRDCTGRLATGLGGIVLWPNWVVSSSVLLWISRTCCVQYTRPSTLENLLQNHILTSHICSHCLVYDLRRRIRAGRMGGVTLAVSARVTIMAASGSFTSSRNNGLA